MIHQMERIHHPIPSGRWKAYEQAVVGHSTAQQFPARNYRLLSVGVVPAAFHAVLALEKHVRQSSRLESFPFELVRMRASRINGCACCLDMHSKDTWASGETEQRLDAQVAALSAAWWLEG